MTDNYMRQLDTMRLRPVNTQNAKRIRPARVPLPTNEDLFSNEAGETHPRREEGDAQCVNTERKPYFNNLNEFRLPSEWRKIPNKRGLYELTTTGLARNCKLVEALEAIYIETFETREPKRYWRNWRKEKRSRRRLQYKTNKRLRNFLAKPRIRSPEDVARDDAATVRLMKINEGKVPEWASAFPVPLKFRRTAFYSAMEELDAEDCFYDGSESDCSDAGSTLSMEGYMNAPFFTDPDSNCFDDMKELVRREGKREIVEDEGEYNVHLIDPVFVATARARTYTASRSDTFTEFQYSSYLRHFIFKNGVKSYRRYEEGIYNEESFIKMMKREDASWRPLARKIYDSIRRFDMLRAIKVATMRSEASFSERFIKGAFPNSLGGMLEDIESFRETCSTLFNGLDENFALKMTHLFFYIFNFYRATTFEDHLAQIGQFLTDSTVWSAMPKRVLKLAKEMFAQSAPVDVRREASLDGVDQTGSFPLMEKWKKVLMQVTATSFLQPMGEKASKLLTGILNTILLRGEQFVVGKALYEVVVETVRAVALALTTGDWTNLFGLTQTEKLLAEGGPCVERLIANRVGKYGSPPSTLLEEAQALITRAQLHLSKSPSDKQVAFLLTSLMLEKKRLEGSMAPNRPATVGVYIFGPPGIGKTTGFVNILEGVAKARLNIPETVRTVFTMQPLEFQEVPGLTTIVLNDDVLRDHNERVKPSESFMTLVTMMCNNAPFGFNHAAVEDKNIKFEPTYLVNTSNIGSYSFVGCTPQGLERLVRRLICVKCAWTAQALELSRVKEVPLEKLRETFPGRYDLVEYTVTMPEMDAKDPFRMNFYREKSIFVTADIFEVVEYLEGVAIGKQRSFNELKSSAEQPKCAGGYPKVGKHADCGCGENRVSLKKEGLLDSIVKIGVSHLKEKNKEPADCELYKRKYMAHFMKRLRERPVILFGPSESLGVRGVWCWRRLAHEIPIFAERERLMIVDHMRRLAREENGEDKDVDGKPSEFVITPENLMTYDYSERGSFFRKMVFGLRTKNYLCFDGIPSDRFVVPFLKDPRLGVPSAILEESYDSYIFSIAQFAWMVSAAYQHEYCVLNLEEEALLFETVLYGINMGRLMTASEMYPVQRMMQERFLVSSVSLEFMMETVAGDAMSQIVHGRAIWNNELGYITTRSISGDARSEVVLEVLSQFTTKFALPLKFLTGLAIVKIIKLLYQVLAKTTEVVVTYAFVGGKLVLLSAEKLAELAGSFVMRAKKDEMEVYSEAGVENPFNPPPEGWTLEVVRREGPTVSKIFGSTEVPSWVPPYSKVPNVWMPHNDIGKEMKISSGDYSLWTTPLGQNLFVTAGHFFIDEVTLEPVRREFDLTLLDGNKLRVKVSPRHVMASLRPDIAYFVLENYPIAVEPFLRIASRAEAHSIGIWKGEAIQIELKGSEYHHRALSTYGDCGKPLLSPSGILLGVHYASENHNVEPKKRYVNAITEELVVSVGKEFVARGVPVLLHSDALPEMMTRSKLSAGAHPNSDLGWLIKRDLIPSWSEFHRVWGHLPSCDSQRFTAHKTTMFQDFETEMEEMKLNYMRPPDRVKAKEINGEWVSTVTRKVSALVSPHELNLDRAVIDHAIDYVVSKFKIPERKLEVLSRDQSIVGDCRNAFLRPRDNSKSVGASLRFAGLTAKKAFVEKTPNEFQIEEKLDEEMGYQFERMLRGRPNLGVVQATFKDEVISEKAFNNNKLRLFSVLDAGTVYPAKRPLMPLIAMMLENPFETGMLCAFNPTSLDAGELKTMMTSLGEDGYECDYSSMDNSHSVTLGFASEIFLKYAKKCGYNRDELWLLNSSLTSLNVYFILLEGNFVRLRSQLASGRPDTWIVNALINILDRVICAMKWEAKRPIPRKVEDVLVVCAGGDDNLTGVAPGSAPGSVMQACSRELGLVLTSATDKGQPPSLQKVLDGCFLKRIFKFDEILGRWVMPLDKKSLLKSLTWSTGRMSAEEQRKRDISAALSCAHEFFFRGEQEYSWFKSKLAGMNEAVKIVSYEQFKARLELGLIKDLRVNLIPRNSSYPFGEGELTLPESTELLQKEGLKGEPSRNLPSTNPTDLNSIENVSLHEQAKTVSTPRVEDVVKGVEPYDVSTYGNDPTLMSNPKWLLVSKPFGFEGTIPFCDSMPTGLFTALSFGKRYYRYESVKITITTQGNAGLYGASLLSVIPQWSSHHNGLNTTYDAFQKVNCTSVRYQLPLKLVIDVNKPCTCEMIVPWAELVNYIYRTEVPSWVLYCEPLIPIQSVNGGSVTDPKYSIYVEYIGLDFHGIRREGARDGENSFSYLLEYAKRIGKGYVSPAIEVLRLGLGLATKLGFSRPYQVASKGVISLLASPALTEGCPMIGHTLGTSTAVGRDVAVKLPLEEENETSFEYMAGRASLVREYAEQDIVYSVHPMAYIECDNTRCLFTNTGFAASFFQYYRCDIEVTMTWYSSSLIRAKIIVWAIQEGESTSFPFDQNGTGTSYVCDVVGTTKLTFKIPYTNPSFFTDTAFGFVNDYPTPAVMWEFLEPPSTPYGSATLSACTIETRGINFEGIVPKLTVPLALEGKFDGEEISNAAQLTRRRVLQAVVQSPSSSTANWPVDGALIPEGTHGVTATPLGVYMTAWTYPMWLSMGFLNKVGGYVYGIHNEVGAGTEDHVYVSGNDGIMSGDIAPSSNMYTGPMVLNRTSDTGLAIIGVKNYTEVVIPDRQPFPWRSARIVPYNFAALRGNCSVVTVQRPGNSDYTYLYQAGGEDFRVGGFLGAPLMLIPDE